MAAAVRCIDPATLNAWLAQGNTVLIDVRQPAEHAREHIPGSRLMPLSQLEPHTLPSDKRIVLCCASGCRSKTAARRLGMDGLAHLEGGLAAWAAAGLPTSQGEAPRQSAAHLFATRIQLA